MDVRRTLLIPSTRFGLLLSGGMGSTATSTLLRAQEHEVSLVEVAHASRLKCKRAEAAPIAAHFTASRIIVRIDFVLLPSRGFPPHLHMVSLHLHQH